MFRLTIKLLVFGLIVYGAVGAGMPFVRYYQFRDAVEEAAIYGNTVSFQGRRPTSEQVLDKLAKVALELNVPVERDDLVVKVDNKLAMTIDTRYTVQLEYFPRRYYPHEFAIHAEGIASRYRSVSP